MPKKRPSQRPHRPHVPRTLAASVDRYRQEREQTLQSLEEGSSLGQRRQSFLRQLHDADVKDKSVTWRHAGAKDWTKKANTFGLLEQDATRLASKLRELTLRYAESLNGIPQEDAEVLAAVVAQRLPDWASVARKGRDVCRDMAQWYRGSGKRTSQWGPAVCGAVGAILQSAEAAITENNWNRELKPRERARYYAGLLCMEARLLDLESPSQQKVADALRQRLKRQPQSSDNQPRFFEFFLTELDVAQSLKFPDLRRSR